ncbi:hypothetical protein BGZ72_001001 [Mortierella alpina]|nr:hypothetical protein BGZ72_001001 [Mortierella alpina]
MVRQSRSNSKTYRTANEAPETPLTPHTPRSPHLHRSRILASTPSRPALKRQHTEDFDVDMGPASAKLAQLPNANPTPSEILSMDLNTLALSGSNHRSMMATPSSRLSDDAIERLNLTLPFARLSSSSSSTSPQPSSSRVVSRGSLESVHRTPVRESAQEQQQYSYPYQQQQQQQQHYAPSTPTSSKVAYHNKDRLATPPNCAIAQQRSGLLSPPRSQPIADEENNVFLSRSPRAIRTPRRSLGKAHQLAMTRQSAAEKPAPLSDTIMHTTSSTTTTTMAPHTPEAPSTTMGTLQGDSIYVDPSEDDAVETESVQSSQGGDLEKENHTPKIMECDPSNPFLVMESKRPLPARIATTSSSSSHSKNEGCTTPTGPSSGSITRSRRLALGSISPWRWNTFDEHTSLLALANLKGTSSSGSSKGLGLLEGASCGAHSKADPSVSEWVESTQHHKGHSHPASEAAAVTGNGPAADTTSTSSSSTSSASSSTAAPVSAAAAAGSKSRSGTGMKFTTSSALFGPPIGGKGKLPEHHPNSAEAAAERKAGPSSSIVAKLTENVIQPHSVAFNRRAQQVAGRIYYWKHGSYHLVSDQDKQQWPGEWKFEVFQDPESPGATMSCTAQQGESSNSSSSSGGGGSSSNSSSGAGNPGSSNSNYTSGNSHSLHVGSTFSSSSSSSSTTATYHGKGKLTDRQLSGPASKRLRVHREPLAGFNEASSVATSHSPLQQQQQPEVEVSGIASVTTTTSRTGSSRSVQAAGHRYHHGTPPPPSSPSRRVASRLRQDAGRSAKQSRLQDRYDFRERRMLNEPLAQRPKRCGA